MVSGLQESYKAAIDVKALLWVEVMWVISPTALNNICSSVSQWSARHDKDQQGPLIRMFWSSALKYYYECSPLWYCYEGLHQLGSGSIRVWIHAHVISQKCSLLIFTLCRVHAGRERVLGNCVLDMSDEETLTVTCLYSVIPFSWKAEEIYDAQSTNWWLFWRICDLEISSSA